MARLSFNGLALAAMLFLFIPVRSHSQSFEKLWNKADSLEKEGLPRSALDVVQQLSLKAKKEQNDAQFIKSVIYTIKLNSQYAEDLYPEMARMLRREIGLNPEPVRSVLYSLLGEVLWNYSQNQAYQVRGRTPVAGWDTDSLELMDSKLLSLHTTRAYLRSLRESSQLKEIPIGKFSAVMESSSKEKDKNIDPLLRPTLYDVLLDRALEYFTSAGLSSPVQSVHAFSVNKPVFFDQTEGFTALDFFSTDSLSVHYFALKLYQQAALFHFNDKNPTVLIDYELKRLRYVFENAQLIDRDSIYESSLRTFQIRNSTSSAAAFALAEYLNEQGNKYQPLDSELHKWQIKEALEICEQTAKLFPDQAGGKNCSILARQIRRSEHAVTTHNAVVPEKSFLASVSWRNTETLYLRIVALDQEELERVKNSGKQDELVPWLTSLPHTESWAVKMPSDGDYQQHTGEISIPGSEPGFYVLLSSGDSLFKNKDLVISYVEFWSTNLAPVTRAMADGRLEVYVLDRSTGRPLKGVQATAYTKVYNHMSRYYENHEIGDYVTDESGFFIVSPPEGNRNNQSIFLKLKSKTDQFETGNHYLYRHEKRLPKPVLQTVFYTDRSIYRPGQTVWFKGIITERNGDQSTLKKGLTTTVIFRDVNYNKISESAFTTNDFGSFNGSFVAPAGVLTGEMTISNESGSVTFSVEEYKRPTFEITFLPVEGFYRLNEPVVVKGSASAYAGAGLGGAKVSWRVVRTARFPWWGYYRYRPMPYSQELEIGSGTGVTNDKGGFQVEFITTPDLKIDPEDKPVFNYTIYVDITDMNGEMQSSEASITVGYLSMFLGHSLNETVNIHSDSVIKITSTNLDGQKTAAEVTVILERLRPMDRIILPRQWATPDKQILRESEFRAQFPYDPYGDEDNPAKRKAESVVLSKVLDTAKDSVVNLSETAGLKLNAGEYVLTLKSTDPFGQPVEAKSYFTAYDPDSKEMPARTPDWFVPLKTNGEPGEKARFLVGSSEDDVRVLFEIMQKDSLVSRQVVTLFDRQRVVEVPILEKYRGNFTVNFLFVKNNREFQKSVTVLVPFTDKKLGISLESFRSRLTPGQKEEWKIRILDPDKKPVNAEFLVSMYDASLDAFRFHSWSFGHDRPLSYQNNPWRTQDAFRIKAGTITGAYRDYPGYEFTVPDRINWFGFYFPYSGFRGGEKMYRLTPTMDAPRVAGISANEEEQSKLEMTQTSSEVKDTGAEAEAKKVKSSPGPQIRKDFRETAFFYPRLVTDSAGAVFVSFTAPESLTRWKLLGLAHTGDLKYALLERELVTRKDLMVFPNVPRFVRLGDTVVFTARIMNLSELDLAGSVRLSLTDPLTGASLDHLIRGTGNELQFAVKKGETASIAFMIRIPADASFQVLQFRMAAQAGDFSDGEERAIPVLPNRTMVTETLPLPVNGKGTFSFTFDKMKELLTAGSQSQTLSNYRLTLEFASNPAWYAVQALPSLNEIQYKSADQVFSAFYSNSLASHIASSDPTIKSVFESWQKFTPDALLSNLEKNEDLKSALLKETPWVLDARDETTNKQRLGLYFEQNNLDNNLRQNFNLLLKMQLPNGAWSWFPEMPENRWVTQEIVAGFGRLKHLGVKSVSKDERTTEMVSKAIGYLDGELVRDYANIKKYSSGKMDENHLSATQIQYLYAVSFFQKAPAGDREAFDYFISQAKKYWLKQELSLQAMIALALHRMGDKVTPAAIMKSLSEKALHSREFGMYWAVNEGYRWYETPVETQAMMIEAYDEVSADLKSVDELNIWLLKQKQTRMWRTKRATLDACYALLLRGTDLLSADPGVTIKVGQQNIDPKKLQDNPAEAGTGYFRISWTGITPDMAEITVSKASDGIAWGGLYWQYFENLDKITKHQSPLSVEKQLFKESNTESGPVLTPISVNDPLSLGDKVKVRIVLKSDRDMEFVHMKDLRSAGLEPTEMMSGYRYRDMLGYYQAPGDISTSFFFDYLPKGTYVFEYTLKVNTAGAYSNGITTVQCLYAPEFAAHSDGTRVKIEK